MEYLQTPDSSARIFALPTPGNDRPPTERPADRQALRSSFQSLFSPDTSCGGGSADGPAAAATTPGMPPFTPAFGHAMAASSQQQQAYLHRQTPLHHFQHHHNHTPQTHYPGLTPFLGAVTPALAPGAQALPAHFGLPSSSPRGGSAPETPAVGSSAAATPAATSHGLEMQRNSSPQTSATTPAPAGGASLGQLTSPFLQAAAKEAVRREFMNMPSYIAAGGAADSSSTLLTSEQGHRPSPSLIPSQQPDKPAGIAEQTVPGNDHVAPSSKSNAVATALSRAAPAPRTGACDLPQHPLAQTLHPAQHQQMSMMPMMHYPYPPYPGMMYMPYHGMQAMQGVQSVAGMMMPTHKSDADGGGESQVQGDCAGNSLQTQLQNRPDIAHQHQMQGMVVMGPNGPMMVPAPGYAYPQHAHPQMMMSQIPGPHPTSERSAATEAVAAAAAAALLAAAPTQPESSSRRRERVEQEKQDLIREFKKKTREAALVRFRQKRRERRFGKLIRYDCRKKLADARPRIKGRFVRVKDGEEDDPMSPEMDLEHEEIDSPLQVVPQY